jgi:ribosomal protein L11 methyltransferase
LSLVRLGIRLRADRAEVALAQLLGVLQAGAEERQVDGAVEYALYGRPDGLPGMDEIRSLAGDALLEVRAEPVADGWDVRWHEYLRPVRVGDLVVRPPWIEGSPDDLVIDPGPFFGAGTHATTRLCLELLQDCQPGGALCDWGAGTGVLAIAAARLGWDPVTAVELEAAALGVIRSNAARNRVEVKALAADVRDGAPRAPTVVANLPRPTLVDAASALVLARRREHGVASEDEPAAARPLECVIVAGMLSNEADSVAAAFAPLRERRRVDDEGWAALVLV